MNTVGTRDDTGATVFVLGGDMTVGELGSGRVYDDGHVSTRRSGMNGDRGVNRDTEIIAAAAGEMSGCVGGHC